MTACFVRVAALGLLVLGAGMSPASAQTTTVPAPMTSTQNAPHNVLQLSASGQVEVEQDLLTLSLGATREGADAASAQASLRQVLDEALKQVRPSAQPGNAPASWKCVAPPVGSGMPPATARAATRRQIASAPSPGVTSRNAGASVRQRSSAKRQRGARVKSACRAASIQPSPGIPIGRLCKR